MNRTSVAVLLVLIVCAESCARASASPDAGGVPAPRIIMVGDRLEVRAGPVLTALPPDQRYRFVPPESLAMDLAAADESSIEEPRIAALRRAFSAVMENGRWVETEDSVHFDVTIFTTSRTTMRREARPHLASNVPTCGDHATTQLQWCTDDPLLYTENWSAEYRTFQVIRRRSDGALRVWRLDGFGPSSFDVRVAPQLLEMLRAGAQEQASPARVAGSRPPPHRTGRLPTLTPGDP